MQLKSTFQLYKSHPKQACWQGSSKQQWGLNVLSWCVKVASQMMMRRTPKCFHSPCVLMGRMGSKWSGTAVSSCNSLWGINLYDPGHCMLSCAALVIASDGIADPYNITPTKAFMRTRVPRRKEALPVAGWEKDSQVPRVASHCFSTNTSWPKQVEDELRSHVTVVLKARRRCLGRCCTLSCPQG